MKLSIIIICILLSGCGGKGGSSSGSAGATPGTLQVQGSAEFKKGINAATNEYTPPHLKLIREVPGQKKLGIYRNGQILDLRQVKGKQATIGILAHESSHGEKNHWKFANCEDRVFNERKANLNAARVLKNLGYNSQANWWRNQDGNHSGCK